jgi:thioesterase domain-containing protein
MDRLNQLSVQASAQNGARSLLNGPLAEKLNITDEQKEELRETAEELQKKFNDEVTKLREEMQAKLIEKLTTEQQAELKEITGEKFTFERQQRGNRGAGGPRDGGGRGGAGNRRGGGGNRGGRGGRRGEDNGEGA